MNREQFDFLDTTFQTWEIMEAACRRINVQFTVDFLH